MPAELLTIDTASHVWGDDFVQRFISRELASSGDVRLLRIDHQIRVGVPLGRMRRPLPVFAECRSEKEFPKLMAIAAPDYHGGWAQGILSVRNDKLQRAAFWFPRRSEWRLTHYLHLVYDQVAPGVVIPPHHQIVVNGRLQFGLIPDRGVVEQYYLAD